MILTERPFFGARLSCYCGGVQLHHLALGARDVRLVAQFYREAFGLAVLQEHLYDSGELRSIWLDLGSSILMIEHSSEANRDVQGIGAGLFLLAFRVQDSDRRRVEDHLSALGAVVESRTSATSYTRDPEGNRVAISHYQKE